MSHTNEWGELDPYVSVAHLLQKSLNKTHQSVNNNLKRALYSKWAVNPRYTHPTQVATGHQHP